MRKTKMNKKPLSGGRPTVHCTLCDTYHFLDKWPHKFGKNLLLGVCNTHGSYLHEQDQKVKVAKKPELKNDGRDWEKKFEIIFGGERRGGAIYFDTSDVKKVHDFISVLLEEQKQKHIQMGEDLKVENIEDKWDFFKNDIISDYQKRVEE